MAGRIVNLAVPNQSIPGLIVVDTNVITHFLLASFFAPQRLPVPLHIQQATQFFQDLQAVQGTGLVMPSTYIEFVHVAIMGRYKHEINTMTKLQMLAKYGKAFSFWEHLYKNDSTVLQGFKPQLETLRQLLIVNGLLFVDREWLAPVASGRGYDEELIDFATRFGLDSRDAAILMETQRSGLLDIVTFDKDMQRAQPDFNIYTWI